MSHGCDFLTQGQQWLLVSKYRTTSILRTIETIPTFHALLEGGKRIWWRDASEIWFWIFRVGD